MFLKRSFLGYTSQGKKTLAALSVVLIFILINLFIISNGTYVWGEDTGLPIYSFSVVKSGLYIWSNLYNSGAPVPVASGISIIFGILQSFFSFLVKYSLKMTFSKT